MVADTSDGATYGSCAWPMPWHPDRRYGRDRGEEDSHGNRWIPAIARAALLAVPALVLGSGLGGTLEVDRAADAAQPPERGALDLTPHHSVVVEGIPGTRGWLSERCPAGQVVAGGFSHVGAGLRVTESRPDGIYAWRISWVQTSTDDAVLYVYAICLLDDG